MAFRVLFAIAAYYDLDIDQMDVKTDERYGRITCMMDDVEGRRERP